LDRLLDRGVYLQADLIVTVAGVPLLGARLNALLGGVETLIAYGVFRDWDAAIRSERMEPLRVARLELPASLWSATRTERRWLSGTLDVAPDGLTLHDGAGMERLRVPYGTVRNARVGCLSGRSGAPATCLRLTVAEEEIWVHVHHMKSLLAALTGVGIPVDADRRNVVVA
ncbi:Gas vesicle protein GvpA, partial [mine drainage metagenome]